jgi:hypothetical protein
VPQHQLHSLAPPQATSGGSLNPVRHLYYWLRWQISGTLLPDGYGGSK